METPKNDMTEAELIYSSEEAGDIVVENPELYLNCAEKIIQELLDKADNYNAPADASLEDKYFASLYFDLAQVLGMYVIDQRSKQTSETEIDYDPEIVCLETETIGGPDSQEE